MLPNVLDLSKKDQEILKKQIENTIKEISIFFDKEQIEALARETKFVKRKSKLTGQLFLSVFVFGAIKYGNPSIEQLLSILDSHIEDLELSRSGLHQRINGYAVTFFKRILNISIQKSINLKIDLPKQFGHILIWDSTFFQLPSALAPFFRGQGGSASPAGAKIQFCYDLKHHDWRYALTSATQPDNSMKDQIISMTQAGDLVIQDLGYFNAETFAAINDKGAYYLSRLKRDAKLYLPNIAGVMQGFDLATLLECEQFEKIFELNVYVRSKRNSFTPTRLVIEKLPEPVINERLRKSNKLARSRGRQLSARTIFLAKFNFYITNAPSDLLPASCCRFLYAVRWQVELVFKAWKSHLKIHKFHVKHREERVQVTIFSKLIFITLTTKIIGVSRDFLWLVSRREISYYRALTHFQSIAEKWFSLVLSSAHSEIFTLLQNAVSFIKRCFKIPQHDRLYPLERLQLFGDIVFIP